MRQTKENFLSIFRETLLKSMQFREWLKILSADKPDSVVLINQDGHHLSCHNITVMILLPTLQRCHGKTAALNGPLSTAGVHGITAHKVYPLLRLPVIIVSPYLTFSPLSHFVVVSTLNYDKEGRLFSVALSVFAVVRNPALNRCVALCCPDFPFYL